MDSTGKINSNQSKNTLIGFIEGIGNINLIEFDTYERGNEVFRKLKIFLNENPINLTAIEDLLGPEVSLDDIEFIKFADKSFKVNL